MTDRPILFSGPMVRATLDGSKTLTRRVMNPQPVQTLPRRDRGKIKRATPDGEDWDVVYPPGWLWLASKWRRCFSAGDESRLMDALRNHRWGPFGLPGTRLWVRETFALHRIHDPVSPSKVMPTLLTDRWFAADGAPPDGSGRWRPSIHMPRWASRITLEVTDVRVERLQDISEDDAEAEGIERGEDFFQCPTWKNYQPDDEAASWFPDDPVGAFRTLWDSINGKRPGCAWDDNPWVWVVEFKRLEAQS
jgi:hypothetical protein